MTYRRILVSGADSITDAGIEHVELESSIDSKFDINSESSTFVEEDNSVIIQSKRNNNHK